MDIVVTSRHCAVPERFRTHVADKIAKLARYDGKAIRLDVEVSEEHNPRLADCRVRVELTLRSRGPVVRAEACAQEVYCALDLAVGRLEARLRKAADRRRVHHGNRTPVSLAAATSSDGAARPGPDGVQPAGPAGSAGPPVEALDEAGTLRAEGPLVVREKRHVSASMTLDQALYEMELVGHDFFLFHDADADLPSVVYRRHAYDYGVIRLVAAERAGARRLEGVPAG